MAKDSNNKNLLTLENIESGYGKVKVLHNVSLKIKEGQIVTIVGANGVGKSTTIKTILNLIIFIFTVIITLILSFFIKNTKLGIAMRGVSYNKQTAEAMGINSTSIIVATFVIGSALAAVAGVAWGLQYGNVRPAMGYHPGISGFIAAVLGGIGNISGAAISGFLLGVGQVLFVAFLPSVYSGFRPLFVWIVLFIILFYKPTGLFRSNIKWE